MAEQRDTFDSVQGLYETADQLPYAERHDVYGNREDDWEQIGWRDSLWLEGYGAVGDVSSSDDYYNVIQYGDVLEAVGDAVELYENLEVSGYTSLSPSGHRMSTRIDFYGDTDIEVVDGDEINLGLKVRSGHSGYHALKYDVGAERQICSNGMMAFVSDLHFEQTHQQELDYSLAHQAVDAVVKGADEVEERLRQAREREFHNYDEAILVLMDFGLDAFFDEPIPTFRDALDAETEGEQPTLYDTYNAATRALTHETEDMPQYQRDQGLEQASELLDYGSYGLPDADYLGTQAIERRVDEYLESEETDSYFEEEEETLQELITVRGVDG